MSSDAGHITKPSPRGAARALRAALRDAGIGADEVGYVNAHGTGTPLNDAVESDAIRDVFGEGVSKLMVSSTKSMHGHALGGAGALEAVATVLALVHGIVPPTANFLEPDPACPIDCVPNQAREARVRYALSSSFAFGGLNGVLAFQRTPDEL
jgi:nodulation protein E